MKKRVLFVVVSVLYISLGFAQGTVWQKTDGKAIRQSNLVNRVSVPSQYQLFSLNIDALKAQLANAPLRGKKSVSDVVVQFPDGNGELKSFRIYEAPVIADGLTARYPNMKSYVGQGVDKPSDMIRFSTTMYGLHNMMFSSEGTSYIDPYTKDLSTYIVYKRASVMPRQFFCGVKDKKEKSKKEPVMTTFSENATDGIMRTYRLAMACTVEYAAFHIDEAGLTTGTLTQKKEAVLAAMVVTVTRVNSVYERDFAITLELVDDNDDLIFINSDEFDNENTDNILLFQSQEVIDDIIGHDNYDIGHTVSTGGGGVAQLYSPCSEYKAMGITGLYAPVGDPYDIDFVAHEIGHQFGGNHTFNNSCDGNRNDGTAYETGSGSTIMAYAGVCFPSVQDHSDAHFHNISVQEITWFIQNWGDCSANAATGNQAPTVDAGPNHTIPKSTPFILKGIANDPDGDDLTYCWEQMDLQVTTQPPVASAASGPNFRSLPPAESSERYLPSLSAVLANNLAPTWEVISNVARNYNFVLTVRDNNPLGGQTVYDEMQVTVSGAAGPFLVTAPNTNVSWPAGSNQTVTWDVAGTTANGVNTAFVDIYLSNDGGLTYPVALATHIANDGNETITVPDSPGTNKRIMVRANGNIFYDISNTNFTITAASTMAVIVSGDAEKEVCQGNSVDYVLAYQTLGGFIDETAFTVAGNPAGSSVSFDPEVISEAGTVLVTVSVPENVAAGEYTLIVTATSGSIAKTATLYLDVLEPLFGDVIPVYPTDGTNAVPQAVMLSWQPMDNATGYNVQVATDNGFEDIIFEEVSAATSVTLTLEELTDYYWRVLPFNATCPGEFGNAFTFRTGVTACVVHNSADVPKAISSTVVIVNSTLTITDDTPLNDLTVNMNISHSHVSDLTVSLTSPAGTQVTLFANLCEDANNVDATFSDFGTAIVCGNNPAISGTVLPMEALSAFKGESPEGIWTLRINDGFNQDGGQLTAWSLDICSTTEEPVTGTDEHNLSGLSVYPNPNRGDFTVRFHSVTGNDIKIMVHDIGGRQLMSKTVANSGLTEEQISLGNVQAGVYLVNIQDGDTSVTKKIIIQ